MEGIAEAIDRTDLVLGEDYQVLTISFDARETTDLAVNKKRNHLTPDENQEAENTGNFLPPTVPTLPD
jgi:protein SCO1